MFQKTQNNEITNIYKILENVWMSEKGQGKSGGKHLVEYFSYRYQHELKTVIALEKGPWNTWNNIFFCDYI